MSKLDELYKKLFLEQEDEEAEPSPEAEPPTEDEASPEAEPPTEEEPTENEEEKEEGEEEPTEPEEEPAPEPEEIDRTDAETEAKAEARIEDMAEKISDEMLNTAMERFDAFRKVLKKKGVAAMVSDFIDNFFTRRLTTKVDSLFVDLYADEVKERAADKLKAALTDLSLGKEAESEPVPEQEETLWTP